MNRELIVDIVKRLPAGAASRAWGWLARRRHPRLAVRVLQEAFVRATGINLDEAAKAMGGYESLEALFVRRLREGARQVDPDPNAVVSPVDGCVGACGKVTQGTLLQVKGRAYSLSKLLDDEEEASRYEGGVYCTLYLSPRDYHRVHAPADGCVREALLVPGRLLPVFPEAVSSVDDLFAKNERLITFLDSSKAGRIAVVKVGATLVGRISAAYDRSLATNIRGERRRHLRYDPPHAIAKGGEIGAFELGSTVVLVAERGRITFDQIAPGRAVRMGERIGTMAQERRSGIQATKPARVSKRSGASAAPKARQRGRNKKRRE